METVVRSCGLTATPCYFIRLSCQTHTLPEPFEFELGGNIDGLTIAYETWGELNADRSNAVLIHTGLSASSHARSHPANPAPGWWERFIGPGLAIDTNKFFVICTNVIGSCYGACVCLAACAVALCD